MRLKGGAGGVEMRRAVRREERTQGKERKEKERRELKR